MAKIFWVEDQSHWIEKFKPVLNDAKLDDNANELLVFKFSEAARQKIKLMHEDERPDVAILDAKMNGYDQAGFSVSEALQKKWPGIPIIFLSEYNGTAIERDALEEHNASDFISKHQNNIEEVLIWRIKAILRQSVLRGTGTAQSTIGNILSSGELKIDLDTWEVFWHGKKLMNPDNPKRPLAPTPRKILKCLVERSPRPVTTTGMAEFLNVDPDTYQYATYRQHIKTLRRAIDFVDGGNGEFMELCKNGVGIVAFGEEGAYFWKPPAKA
jgi:DNA-binding response OmpR family regulator